jgi:hypothetical protein
MAMIGSNKVLCLVEIIYAKAIDRIVERDFSLFCCGCKVQDQDCLMADEFEKWEIYGRNAMEELRRNHFAWNEFSKVAKLLNIPVQSYVIEHITSLETDPDLMLIESLFQEYLDNEELIKTLRKVESPNPYEMIKSAKECYVVYSLQFRYYDKETGEGFVCAKESLSEAYWEYLKSELQRLYNKL